MSNIVRFNSKNGPQFPKNEELFNRIIALIYEYEGEMDIATVIGILDLLKDEVKGYE